MAREREDGAEEIRVPVIEERAEVTREPRVTERVRISTHTEEVEHELALSAAREDLDIARVAVGAVVPARPEVRVEGDTLIVPVVEEVAFVERRLVLREEIHITRHRHEETRHVRVPLRHQRVAIERRKT